MAPHFGFVGMPLVMTDQIRHGNLCHREFSRLRNPPLNSDELEFKQCPLHNGL